MILNATLEEDKRLYLECHMYWAWYQLLLPAESCQPCSLSHAIQVHQYT